MLVLVPSSIERDNFSLWPTVRVDRARTRPRSHPPEYSVSLHSASSISINDYAQMSFQTQHSTQIVVKTDDSTSLLIELFIHFLRNKHPRVLHNHHADHPGKVWSGAS